MPDANSTAPAMLPTDCPVFQTCNAPICPLDPKWRTAYMRNNEGVCRYLLATKKAGAAEHYRDDPTFAEVQKVAAEVMEKWPAIAKRVEGASRSAVQGAHRRGKRVGTEAPAPYEAPEEAFRPL